VGSRQRFSIIGTNFGMARLYQTSKAFGVAIEPVSTCALVAKLNLRLLQARNCRNR
jgi:hypothetical protein